MCYVVRDDNFLSRLKYEETRGKISLFSKYQRISHVFGNVEHLLRRRFFMGLTAIQTQNRSQKNNFSGISMYTHFDTAVPNLLFEIEWICTVLTVVNNTPDFAALYALKIALRSCCVNDPCNLKYRQKFMTLQTLKI